MGSVVCRTVQQNTSEGAEVAIAVCPDPGAGFHVYLHLVSSLKEQHYSVRAVICDVSVGCMFGGAHDSLTVLEQQ